MESELQPPTQAAISRGGDDVQTTFRIFVARLGPAMAEALRTKLGLKHSDLDAPFPQAKLLATLRDLTGPKE